MVLGKVEDSWVMWSWINVFKLGVAKSLLARTLFEEESVWLISTFVNYVWNTVYIGDSDLKLEKFFGFLKFKFKNCGVSLGWIPGLG